MRLPSKKWQIRIVFFYFSLVGIFGLILRLFPIIDLSITYKNFVHTHSHIALLGWGYFGLTTIIYLLFLKKTTSYVFLFWFTQLSLVGMLISFPIQGYALFSILFSSLFLFASYWFSFLFFKNTKKTSHLSVKLIKAALVFL